MPCKIFVSYRRGVEQPTSIWRSREDVWAKRNMDEWAARSIFEHLKRRLGDRWQTAVDRDDHVFMDTESIQAGANFPAVLATKLNECSLVLLVIGPSWLKATDKGGYRRLRKDDDFVKQEIKLGMSRIGQGAAVVPLLVNGAMMPKVKELAAVGLEGLAVCNAVPVRHMTLGADLDRVLLQVH